MFRLRTVSKPLAYAIGFIVGVALAFLTFSILSQIGFDEQSAAIISFLPLALFVGVWILTLKVVFKL